MNLQDREELTRVGADTPSGQMLRRYWWPVALAADVDTTALPVKVLGEELVIFRAGNGKFGLLDRHCPHRGASLEFGRVEQEGIRCCYHGWLFNVEGQCIEQPAEPPQSVFKSRVRQTSYRTIEAGGMIFAYMGPEPAPNFPPI